MLSYDLVRLFRWLIAISLAAKIAIPIVIVAAFPDLMPDHSARLTAIQLASALTYLILCVASGIGLFRLRGWARPLFAIAFALDWVGKIFSSETHISDIEIYATNIASVCDGALLVLMWMAPLSGRFSKWKSSRSDNRTIGQFLYDRTVRWPNSGRLILAALSAAIVASAICLLPNTGVFALKMALKPDSAEEMRSFVGLFAIFVSATEYVLKWGIFWLVVTVVIFPLGHIGLSYRGLSSRWIYAALGAAAPMVLILLVESVSPQIAERDSFFLPFFGGAPAALVFAAIAGRNSNVAGSATILELRSKGCMIAVAIAAVCLLGLAAVFGEAWSVGTEDRYVEAEWRYRLHHLTWPLLCFSTAKNVRWVPRLAGGKADDLALCKAFALQGDAIAQTMMGEGKLDRLGPVERAAWLDKAAAQDYEPAQQILASMISPLTEDEGVLKDGPKAVQLYLRMAEKGNVLSQVLLGIAYKKGAGVEQDMVATLMWREIAAVVSEAEPGDFQLQHLRKTYDDFAATQPPEQVAEAHRRAQDFLASHGYR